MIREGQRYVWRWNIRCRDGSVLPEGSTITVIARTTDAPYNEVGPDGSNWLCDAANGITVWSTLEQCIQRSMCFLDEWEVTVNDSKNAWYVKYFVEGFEGQKSSGPYDDWNEAYQNFQDIRGYEGVYNVTLAREEDYAGTIGNTAQR